MKKKGEGVQTYYIIVVTCPRAVWGGWRRPFRRLRRGDVVTPMETACVYATQQLFNRQLRIYYCYYRMEATESRSAALISQYYSRYYHTSRIKYRYNRDHIIYV